MKALQALLVFHFTILSGYAQQVFWSEAFNSTCPDNCLAQSYSGINGAWSVNSIGMNGNFANEWFVSRAENGEPSGSCGTQYGTNATLHVGSVPCTLCAFFCPTGDCGSTYNAGPTFSGEDPTTNKRVESPIIDCTSRNNISLKFKYHGRGQTCSTDYCSLVFSSDAGASWSTLVPCMPASYCAGNVGRWVDYAILLPVSANNNPNVKIGFQWINNSDGTGNDPSFAVDDIELSVPSLSGPTAGFSSSPPTGCDSICVTFTDTSLGGTSRAWSFPGGNPVSSTDSVVMVCYNQPGSYHVTIVSVNSNGSDTLISPNFVSVIETPVPDFSVTDQNICNGDCIDFTSLTTGPVQSYTWTFQGGVLLNSNDTNPANICYSTNGSFLVSLAVSNNGCTNSITRVNYISVSQPAQPTINVIGDSLVSSPALTYQWYNVATGLINGAFFQYYNVLQDGLYYVCVQDGFGCNACSDTVFVSASAIRYSDYLNAIILYPVPASNVLYLDTQHFRLPLEYSIYDITGKTITRSKEFTFSSEISVTDFPSGFYLIELKDPDTMIRIPFIKN